MSEPGAPRYSIVLRVCIYRPAPGPLGILVCDVKRRAVASGHKPRAKSSAARELGPCRQRGPGGTPRARPAARGDTTTRGLFLPKVCRVYIR